MSAGMVVGKALVTKGCASCRLSLLRSFVSLAAPPIRLSQKPIPSRHVTPSQKLRYSLQSTQHELESEPLEGKEEFEDETSAYETEGMVEQLGESPVAPVPWYLQVESPQREVRPLSERQKIPELPEAPPPILAPLLQRISIDLGLDDLSLLDLRKLDPPPALGANLLMLIGTARSEKHLHVSADRLCRWLRSEYKLRPSADGLLGRNELKLKLRRKAKRAKLMGGSEESFDDGIRTGWVCVDMGIVEEAEGVAADVTPQDFVGFGRRTEGVRMVVQMLTEEKREEIELEKLWSGILRRGGQQEIEELQDIGTDEARESNDSRMQRQGAPMIISSILQQTRGFHTLARKLQTATESRFDNAQSPPYGRAASQSVHNVDEIRNQATQFVLAGEYEAARDLLLSYSPHVPELGDDRWRECLFDIFRLYIQDLPDNEAKDCLGAGDTDCDSTTFLRAFYSTFPPFISPYEAETKVWLSYHAREIGHPGYTIEGLQERFYDIRQRAVNITIETYMYLLRALLVPDRNLPKYHGPSEIATQFASEVLYTMHDHGHEVLSEDMLVSLQELISPDSPPETVNRGTFRNDAETFGFISVPMHPMQKRFHALMRALELPLFQDESRIRLMTLYARGEHWLEFWEVFRMAPQHGKPQSALMYMYMFSTVAATNDQRACMTVLRTWLPELKLEEPAVELEGDVAQAVKLCLMVAEPNVRQESEASGTMKPNTEWVRLWRRLQHVRE